MENFVALKDFHDHLKRYFLKHPEKLPQGISTTGLIVKPIQSAWTDNRLENDHQYIRYMDVVFAGNESTMDNSFHSFIITYSKDESILDVMKMEFIK